MAHQPEEFRSPEVAAVFAEYPPNVHRRLLELRRLIFEVAAQTDDVGRIEETLKWGQPSYLTPETRSGTTIRLDQVRGEADRFAIYVHCQTTLVDEFRRRHGDAFTYETTRAIRFSAGEAIPEEAVREFIASALTYHRGKRRVGTASSSRVRRPRTASSGSPPR